MSGRPETTSTYARLAHLPLLIDGYALDGPSRRVSTGLRRFTTAFRLSGDGHDGLGEDVTYESAEHRSVQRAGAVLRLAGTWTLERFSRALDSMDLFPDGPPADVASREYRRWAVESAALDLALRQSGLSLHGVFARRPEPVRFVVSLNLGPAEYDEPTPPADAPCPPMTVIPAPSGFRATPARRREAGRVLSSAHKQRIRHED